MGGRVELLPHQFYIAREVSSRLAPRVLLSDEVGLGKTIEAGLIIHRLLRTGRADRVLLLVPEPLVHQWFVEMMRRFNLWFNIFDEERCGAIEAEDREENPFLNDQWILTSLSFLAENPLRGVQAAAAGWDIVVADEAHHLEWSESKPGPEYRLVEAVAREAPCLILVTATPEQLGEDGHFARLRLLDPDRYRDLPTYHEEAAQFRDVARIVQRIEKGDPLAKNDVAWLSDHLEEPIVQELEESGRLEDSTDAREKIIRGVVDRHGPGRVVFRNTRAAIRGFPDRCAHLIPLEKCAEGGEGSGDKAKTEWVANFLRSDRTRKVLLICKTRKTVRRLFTEIQKAVSSGLAQFHEDLSLVDRDRQAAWFAETDGAQVLVCSEIGGEGRNFQFAHHLILYDLPLDPERLEQRIGRLDRIGQSETIHLHIPYQEGSGEEVLAQWYHQGLNAFERSLPAGHVFYEEFRSKVAVMIEAWDASDSPDRTALASLIKKSKARRTHVLKELEEGRDRLIERSSNRPEVSAEILERVRTADLSEDLDLYMIRLFDHFGIEVEEMSRRTYLLTPGSLFTDAFPSIPRDGTTVTADRRNALQRDDIGFLTWDHPMVAGGIDLLLGSEHGNTAFAIWDSAEERDVMLEALYVLEVVAPARLHVERFLPPTPLRVLVSERHGDVTDRISDTAVSAATRDGVRTRMLADTDLPRHALSRLLDGCRSAADSRVDACTRSAAEHMTSVMREEVDRLRALRRINDNVREEEVSLLEQEGRDLVSALAGAHLRLDALRLIWMGPEGEAGI
jgi:ATP-dependent helicase HepA